MQMEVTQPAAKMLVELSKSQDIVAGDGTTTGRTSGLLLARLLTLLSPLSLVWSFLWPLDYKRHSLNYLNFAFIRILVLPLKPRYVRAKNGSSMLSRVSGGGKTHINMWFMYVKALYSG